MMTARNPAGLPAIAPMLATAGLIPQGDGWGYEFKYDEPQRVPRFSSLL
jgi:hypothetical protein